MQNWVRHRDGAASPQNGQPKPSRQALAANAKVQMKREAPAQQPQQLPVNSSLPSRGFSKAQLAAAPVQQISTQRPSGLSLKRDPYDTDTASIDTTINQSVIQVEDSQQQRGEVADSEDEPEEQSKQTGEDDQIEDQADGDDYNLTAEEVAILQQYNLLGLSPGGRRKFLLDKQRGLGFRLAEGDSYPSTTDGDWEEPQQPLSYHMYDLPPSPSPQRPSTTQPIPRNLHDGPKSRAPASGIFQQSAHIRNEQRLTMDPAQQPRQNVQHKRATDAPRTYPSTYSQPIPQHSVASVMGQNQEHNEIPAHSGIQHPLSIALMIEPTSSHLIPTAIPTTGTQRANLRSQVQPTTQQAVTVQTEEEVPTVTSDIDYECDELFAKSFDQLKRESFDVDPRQTNNVLPNEISEKPLEERLEFAKTSLGQEQQDDFFRSLPAREWEEAGDWFLDQFSNIIQKMKDTRQKKRKAAQGFEDLVEQRHNHVSKKQRLVEDAMTKMKAQGEGLVASPRRGRSPKPKKA